MICETKFNDPPLDQSSIDRTNIICKITYVAHSKKKTLFFHLVFVLNLFLW